MNNFKFVVFFGFALLAGHANAFCFDEAAARYGVDKSLLMAIAKTESGFSPTAHNINKNGSEDIGIMQINSSWLPTLKKYGIDRKRLMDPCTNVHVGAWVLATNFARYGHTWKAVGAYNAASTIGQSIYVHKVWNNLPKREISSRSIRIIDGGLVVAKGN